MSAVFSDDRLHRYLLGRKLGAGKIFVGWMLHNPSTAAEATEDRTSNRGKSFSSAWGADIMFFMNPWAGVATKPKDLWAMSDPVGPLNDHYIRQCAKVIGETGGFVVAAWGSIKPPKEYKQSAHLRLRCVQEILRQANCPLMALGLNEDVSPKHPLYVPNGTPLIPYEVKQ